MSYSYILIPTSATAAAAKEADSSTGKGFMTTLPETGHQSRRHRRGQDETGCIWWSASSWTNTYYRALSHSDGWREEKNTNQNMNNKNNWFYLPFSLNLIFTKKYTSYQPVRLNLLSLTRQSHSETGWDDPGEREFTTYSFLWKQSLNTVLHKNWSCDCESHVSTETDVFNRHHRYPVISFFHSNFYTTGQFFHTLVLKILSINKQDWCLYVT